MKHFKVVVIGMLAVSLFLNARLLVKVSDMEHRVNSISSYQSHLMSRVDSQTSNLHYLLDEFVKEQSWISPIQMDMKGNIAKGDTQLYFTWQVKELAENSEVVFHYKHGQESEYRSVSAIEKGHGLFEAVVEVDIPMQPEWYTHIGGARGPYEEQVEMVVEESYWRDHHENDLSYYVSVTKDDTIKSSQMDTRNIGHLGTSYYGMIEAFGHIDNQGYHISVSRPPYYSDNHLYLTEVYVKKFMDGRLVADEQLLQDQPHPGRGTYEQYQSFQTKSPNANENIEFTSLVVKVVFNNGETFEREIYRK